MPSRVVITGASGKQASSIIPNLYNDPAYELRLVVHTNASLTRMQTLYPGAEVVAADLTQPNDCARVAEGATVVFHVGPPFHPQETQMGLNMVDAAVALGRERGFRHFVYSSVLNPQLRKMLNHDRKRYVEEYLIESGLCYTIVQPGHFMDPYLGMMLKVAAEEDEAKRVFRAAWDPEVAFSFLALADFGAVVAKVVREGERHYFATYPLCSTGPTRYVDVVGEVGSVLGKEIGVERMGYEEAVGVVCGRIFGGEEVVGQRMRDGPERMLLFYDRRGLVGNPVVLEELLERKGTGIEDWVRARA